MIKILLAEDEPDVRQFLKDELTDGGFKVTAVTNGGEAVVSALDDSYDLYLLDMMMPGMNGIQAIQVLRKVTPGIPIIGLTGYVGRGYMSQASAYGVTCLSKPIDMNELMKEINETTGAKSAVRPT